MKRESTIQVLQTLVERRERELENLRAQAESVEEIVSQLRGAIAEVQGATDNFSTAPQAGTRTQEISDAVDSVLRQEGRPLHRREILRRIEHEGIPMHTSGTRTPLQLLGTYLANNPMVESVDGKGTWGLKEWRAEQPEPDHEALPPTLLKTA